MIINCKKDQNPQADNKKNQQREESKLLKTLISIRLIMKKE
jgi:hypothetical protein